MEAEEKENQVWFYSQFLFYYYILTFIVCLAKSHFYPKNKLCIQTSMSIISGRNTKLR